MMKLEIWFLGYISLIMFLITFYIALKNKHDIQDRQLQLAVLFLIAAILAFK